MRVLILGSGGREHALFLKISASPLVKELYIAPGNGGIPENQKIELDVCDFNSILKVIIDKKIELLVVGPEMPLAAGIKNFFKEKIPALLVFGPDQHSARLEASKVFSYEFMEKANIPTAKSHVARNLIEAEAVIKNHSLPLVIKADGLASGKGVSIHHDTKEALDKCSEIFNDKIFGSSGDSILIQEFMQGKEASLFAICNGKEAIYLPTACDYKRVYDHGQGPNTGGMGSFSPGNILTQEHIEKAHTLIVEKVLREFNYTGILYTGLMIGDNTMNVVEFNCRLGDPETQCVLPMMETDLIPYILWSCGKENAPFRIKNNETYSVPTKPGYCINVVLTAAGYPSSDYVKNISLKFPDELPENLHMVHAGTKFTNGAVVSHGGRIASVVVYDKNPNIARDKIYNFIDSLKKLNDFSNLHYRLDIGQI
ncbi:MAG: phosphoribosylamine--glycine ligase [Spirochaetia bacterium]|nr:phosphoribosylamine--glycine ligase [Spirochaetia bacterium]